MKRYLLHITAICLFFLIASCKSAIQPGDLYGKWKYIKVEHPRANPPDSLAKAELQAVKPYIQFMENDTLKIFWNGLLLSHGIFKVNKSNIVFNETLPDKTTREFPFWISKFDGKTMVFETAGPEGTKVTAVKE
jgi:hypothetical protein